VVQWLQELGEQRAWMLPRRLQQAGRWVHSGCRVAGGWGLQPRGHVGDLGLYAERQVM
jgi:hypothetical protein